MNYKKFIDSVVGNIARKIEDEFNEKDHPRDKGGKFASKGGEGKGGSSEPDTAGHFHSSKQVGEEVKEGLKERYAKAHGGEQLPETETEKAAKEELGEADEFDNDEEEQDTVSETETIRKKLRRNMSTHVEDLVDYAKEDGYEAELESEEYMIVRKDGKEYRAHIDKAGDNYYVDRVEEL